MEDLKMVFSVVMPCYNAERFLRDAIESVLSQSLRDFELIIIDDGSTDASASMVEEYRQRDRRVVFLSNDRNEGIVAALNKGLQAARGEFIARLDADDVALPGRLMKQYEFMKAHPDVIICGTALWMVDVSGRPLKKRSYALSDSAIRKQLLWKSPFAHPSVCIRRSVFTTHGLKYSSEFPHAEDFDLWLRAADLGKFANLEEPLTKYRLREGAVKDTYCKESLWSTIRVQWRHRRYADGVVGFILIFEMALLLLPKQAILFCFKKLHGA